MPMNVFQITSTSPEGLNRISYDTTGIPQSYDAWVKKSWEENPFAADKVHVIERFYAMGNGMKKIFNDGIYRHPIVCIIHSGERLELVEQMLKQIERNSFSRMPYVIIFHNPRPKNKNSDHDSLERLDNCSVEVDQYLSGPELVRFLINPDNVPYLGSITVLESNKPLTLPDCRNLMIGHIHDLRLRNEAIKISPYTLFMDCDTMLDQNALQYVTWMFDREDDGQGRRFHLVGHQVGWPQFGHIPYKFGVVNQKMFHRTHIGFTGTPEETHGQDIHVMSGHFMAVSNDFLFGEDNTPKVLFGNEFAFWCEDFDFSLACVEKGANIWIVPEMLVHHIGHSSQKWVDEIYTERNIRACQEKLWAKWYTSGRIKLNTLFQQEGFNDIH